MARSKLFAGSLMLTLAMVTFSGCQQEESSVEDKSDTPQATSTETAEKATPSSAAAESAPQKTTETVEADIFRAPLESELPEEKETSFLILDDDETMLR